MRDSVVRKCEDDAGNRDIDAGRKYGYVGLNAGGALQVVMMLGGVSVARRTLSAQLDRGHSVCVIVGGEQARLTAAYHQLLVYVP